MELSNGFRPRACTSDQTEEFPAPEVSFVRAGVPQPARGRPCACREPGCQGRHDGQPGPAGPRLHGGRGGASQPGPGLRARAQPETSDIRDLESGRGRQTWWPPDRGRPWGGRGSQPASAASQASAPSGIFQVPRHHPIQVHHASLHGRHGAARWSAATVQPEVWRPPWAGGSGPETQP